MNDFHWFIRNGPGGIIAAPTPIAMKTEWAEWYHNYRVNMIDVLYKMHNRDTTRGAMFGAYIAANSVSGATPGYGQTWNQTQIHARTNPNWIAKNLAAVGSDGAERQLRIRIPIAKKVGLGDTYRDDVSYRGTLNPNLSPLQYFVLYLLVWNDDGTGEAADRHFDLNLKINISMTMTNPDLEQA